MTYAKQGDTELIAVVLKCNGAQHYVDTKTLFEYGFANYQTVKAFSAADLTQNVAITETYKDKTTTLDTIAVAPASDVYVTIPKNATIENITKAVDCPESASVPVAVGDKLGIVVLSLNGEALATVDLTAQKEVKATTDEERAAQAAAARNKILKRIAIGVGIVFGILVIVFCCCRYIGYQRRERRRAMRRAKRQERLRQHILIHSDIRVKALQKRLHNMMESFLYYLFFLISFRCRNSRNLCCRSWRRIFLT